MTVKIFQKINDFDPDEHALLLLTIHRVPTDDLHPEDIVATLHRLVCSSNNDRLHGWATNVARHLAETNSLDARTTRRLRDTIYRKFTAIRNKQIGTRLAR